MSKSCGPIVGAVVTNSPSSLPFSVAGAPCVDTVRVGFNNLDHPTITVACGDYVSNEGLPCEVHSASQG